MHLWKQVDNSHVLSTGARSKGGFVPAKKNLPNTKKTQKIHNYPMVGTCRHCHTGSPFSMCCHVYLLVLLVLLVIPISCSLMTTENNMKTQMGKGTENTMNSSRVTMIETKKMFNLSIPNIELNKISHVNKNEREQNAHNCTQWIYNIFGECVVSKLEMSAFWIGISSISIWLLAQFPQMVQNMKRQDAGALSIIFLISILLADIVDCVGTVFIYYVVSHVSHLTESMTKYRVNCFYLTHFLVICWNFLHNYGCNINIAMAVLQGENSIERKEI